MGRLWLLAVFAIVVAAALPQRALAAPTAPPPAATTAAPAAPTAAADASALATARQTGRPVEVTSRGTETLRVLANPSGTMTMEAHTQPFRVLRGAGWVPVETRLHAALGGTVSPGATVTDLTLSNGGGGPLARLGHGGTELSLGWPAALPAPALAGDTATYAEVLPGVDLQVRATADGLAELLVVKTRQAALSPTLSRVRFTTATRGLALSASADGGLVAKDPSGATVFSAAAPVMWETAGPNDIQPRQAPVQLQVGRGELTLRPDARMLADATMRFPLTIDPFVNFGLRQWGNVTANAPNQGISSDPFIGEGAKAGKGCDANGCYLYRSLFAFTGLPYGTHVLSATFGATLYHSWSCSDTPVELWLTGGINNASSWNNTGWSRWLDTRSAHAYNGCGGAVRMLFGNGLAGAVQDGVNQRWPDITVGLKATNEGDVYQWKRFYADASLSVEYNTAPNAPAGLNTQGKGCTIGAGRPWLGTTVPSVTAFVSDPDGGQTVNATVEFWHTGGTYITNVVQNNLGNGTTLTANAPAGTLADGGTYSWRVIVNDNIDWSSWSGWCEFSVDATPPNQAGAVGSTDYPDDGVQHGTVGQTGHFTLAPPSIGPERVSAYLVALNSCGTTACARTVPASAVDHTGAIDLTPDRDGRNNGFVWTVNRAGLPQATNPLPFSFLVHSGTGPAAYWPMNEGTGTTTADAAAHGNTATLTGGAGWTQGRSNASSALSVNGTTAYAATSGPVQARNPDTGNLAPIHTNQSYTVAAWVKPSTVTGSGFYPTAVSSDGVHATPFFLRYSWGPNPRWQFELAPTDADSAVLNGVVGTSTVQTDRWTFVAGTYDSATQTVTLYVNGVSEGSTTIAGTFDSGGSIVIGRGRWTSQLNHYFPGAIEDVRVWNRVVQATELQSLARPMAPAIALPGGQPARVGQPMQVTLSAGGDANVTSYRYGLDDPSLATASTATPGSPGGSVTVNVTASTVDIHTIYAVAVDARSRVSDLGALDVEVDDVPAAPASVSATPGNGQATVTWTAPATDGGSAITGYTVTASPGGQSMKVQGGGTTATVTGLVNGTAYTFTVTATNLVGTSASSPASSAVTPVSPPGAPTGVTAVAGILQATVSWVAPAGNGGSAITGYTVTASPGGRTATANGTTTTATVTGLSSGTVYTFTVKATNAVGTGPASTASNAVTPRSPATVPGAPTGVLAWAGNQQATVTWTPPASNGGSAITGFTVTASPGGRTATAAGTATSATVTGLTNGTTYTFTVTATNAVGTGTASDVSNAVVPALPPGAPTGVSAVAGNGQATVTWTAPTSNGGSAITSYAVIATPGGQTVTAGGTATSATVTGLTNGTAYTFTVTANNSAGAGTPSAASAAVTPSTAAGHVGASFVQQANMYGNYVTAAVTFPGAVTAGNRIVVVVGSWNDGLSLSGVTDSAGNTYTQVADQIGADMTDLSVWTAVVTSGGGTALTVTATDPGPLVAMAAVEYAGLSTAAGTAAVDQVAMATGGTSGPATVSSGPTGATTAANELAVGAYVSLQGFQATASPPATYGGGWTGRAEVEPNVVMVLDVEDQRAALGANPNATIGVGASQVWGMATVVFKVATP